MPPEKYLNSASRWEEDPIFETDDFPAEERRKAFNEGEFLVVKKLVTKVLGDKLGAIVYAPCKNKTIRKAVMFVGFKMMPLLLALASFRKNSAQKKRKKDNNG